MCGKEANPTCKHIESGLYCHCQKDNAECINCKGWFTPEKKPRKTWQDLQEELIVKTLTTKKH